MLNWMLDSPLIPPEKLHIWARNAAPAFLALYLISNVLLRSFTDVWLFIGWASLCAGVILGGVSLGPVKAFAALITLLVFHALAIPGSILWGSGNWELTAGVVLWMAPALFLYLAKDAARVFEWLIPAFFLHAAWIMWEALAAGQNTGMANNANLAAGFLLIGTVYLMTNQKGWWAIPLLVALLLTESRWAMVVAAALLPAMVISRTIPWRPVFLATVGLIVAFLLFGTFGPMGYQIGGYGSLTQILKVVPADIGSRLAVPHIPSFLPSGVAEHPGLHNVPLRIAVENGLLAACLWVIITAVALKPFNANAKAHISNRGHEYEPQVLPSNNANKKQRNDEKRSNLPHKIKTHRWLLLTLVLLSVLDYYTWMGHLGGFWWLLIGLQLKGVHSSNKVSGVSGVPPIKASGTTLFSLPHWIQRHSSSERTQ